MRNCPFQEVPWDDVPSCVITEIHKALQLASAIQYASYSLWNREHLSLSSPPFISLSSNPFYLSVLYRIPCHGTLFSSHSPFLDIDLICLIPFPLDSVEDLRKRV